MSGPCTQDPGPALIWLGAITFLRLLKKSSERSLQRDKNGKIGEK